MRYFPYKFNGFLLQQGNRIASSFDDFDWNISGISTNNAQRNNNRPKYSGKIFGGAVKVVNITLNDVDCDRNNLVISMDVAGSEQHALYALDEFGKQWYVNAVCVGLNTETTEGKTAAYGYIFDVDDPTWTEVSEDSEAWDITASGETHTFVIGGNQPTNPTIEVLPGAPVSYYSYIQYVKNYNPIEYVQTDGIDITGAGWNHAAVVAAGKSLASGDDCRVIVDGSEVPRWVGGGGWNSATTRIFIRLTWQAGRFMPLKTALANAGTPAYIEFNVSAVTLGKLPINGIIRVDAEEISYKNLSPALYRAEIVERNIRGTSIGAHAIGATCTWVEHDIRLIYGNAAAETPVYDDTYKPVYTLATSTNTSRVCAAFADPGNLRAGSFIRQVMNDGIGKLNRVYSGNRGAIPELDPATNMGMEISAYQVQGRVKPESAALAWMYYHPAIITTVTTTGEKYKKAATTTWAITANLESSVDGVRWVMEWVEVIPAIANTWTAFANVAAEALPAGSKYFRYIFAGSINALTGNVINLEVHTVTVALTAANVIQVALNGEMSNLQLNFELRNNTTGESMYVNYPIAQAATLTIDCDKMSATYKGMNAIRGVDWDAIRTEWLKLIPGNNILEYIADITGDVRITIKTHNRGL